MDDGCLGILIIGIMLLLIAAIVVITVSSNIALSEGDYTETLLTIDYIAAMSNNNSQISGSFFLGSGTIGETAYYVYMVRSATGGLTMERTDASICTIYETNEAARIELVRWRSNKWPYVQELHYNIYVPEGSIWYGYEIDVRK